jgi:predicted P-loop ATPase
VIKPLPWDRAADFAPREWTSNDDVRTAGWVQLEYYFAPSAAMIAQAITAVAQDHAYHPVREYLQACQWDGTVRIDRLFLDYFGARVIVTDENREDAERINAFLAAAGRRFMISAVARIMRPGCQVDTAPIVDSKQGAKKSSGFRGLFEPWFTDQLSTPGGKDADEQLRGVWCVELAELEQFDKTEATRMKAFISRREDRFRWSYGTRVQSYPRQNVFVGTTNRDDWGKDETGARRFWPVSASGEIDVAGLVRDRDQIMGEAYAAFKAGEQWHLTAAEEELAMGEQEARRQSDALEVPMGEYLEGRNSASVAEVLTNVLGLEKAKWDQRIQNQVARVFRAWRWQMSKVRTDNGREKRYFRPTEVKARVSVPNRDHRDQNQHTGTTQTTTKQGGGPTGPTGHTIYESRTYARAVTGQKIPVEVAEPDLDRDRDQTGTTSGDDDNGGIPW